MFFHVGAQQRIHLSLVAASLLLEPLNYIAVEPQGELLFRDRLESAPNNALGEHFGRDFGNVRKVNIGVRHGIQPFQVSTRFP